MNETRTTSASNNNNVIIAKAIITLSVLLIILLASTYTFAKSPVRRGETYTSQAVEVSRIESRSMEKQKSGLIWFTFKASCQNRINRHVALSICFQAIDRNGYELEDLCFYDYPIKRRSSANLTKKTVMDGKQYKNIWKWRVDPSEIHIK